MALRRREEKRERRNKTIMSITIAVIMLASMFGIWASAQQDPNNEFGVGFRLTQDPLDRILAKVGGVEQSFYVTPSEALNYPVQGELQLTLQTAPLIIYTFNPSSDMDNLAFLDLVRFDLAQRIPQAYINAVTQEQEGLMLPVYTCQDSSPQQVVVEFIVNRERRIEVQDSCITVQGNLTDFLVARDRFIYEYHGVYGD